MRALGERASGTARLEEAVTAYRAALEEYTRDRVPLDWAATWGNMGEAMTVFADRSNDLAMARQALHQLEEAEAALREGGHKHFATYSADRIPRAQAVIDRLPRAGFHTATPAVKPFHLVNEKAQTSDIKQFSKVSTCGHSRKPPDLSPRSRPGAAGPAPRPPVPPHPRSSNRSAASSPSQPPEVSRSRSHRRAQGS